MSARWLVFIRCNLPLISSIEHRILLKAKVERERGLEPPPPAWEAGIPERSNWSMLLQSRQVGTICTQSFDTVLTQGLTQSGDLIGPRERYAPAR